MYKTTRLDSVFQALAHPARRRILELLARDAQPVMRLARRFRLTQPAVTQHLNVLEDAGLIVRERIGRVRECSLRRDAFGPASGWIERCRGFWETRLDRLESVLARDARGKE